MRNISGPTSINNSTLIESLPITFEKAATTAVSPLWSTVLWTAFAAIIATIIAALLARSLKISEFRQAWINSLRDDVAEIIGSLGVAHDAGMRAQTEFNATAGNIWKTEYDPAISRSKTLQARIRLRINPNQNKNSTLDEAFLSSLNAFVEGCVDREKLCSDFDTRRATFETQARQLLKREWESTKRGRS